MRRMDVRKKGKTRGCCGSTELGIVALRRSWREIFCEKRRTRTKQEKTGAGLSSVAKVGALAVNCAAWQERSGGMSRTHRGVMRKSSPCQCATQIVFRIAVMAGKIWTSQTEDGFHLGCRYMHAQQFSSEPQIDDAPVRLGKVLANMPTLRPALIDAGGSLGSNRGRLFPNAREMVRDIPHRSCRLLGYQLRGRMQQVMGGTGEERMSFHNLYPRSITGDRASLALLIGEACQSSQMTPVGAGQVASVGACQLLTNSSGHDRLQGCAANANPSLEMARAALEHDTRFMAIGSHELQDIVSGVIEIEENVAGVILLGIGKKIYVITLMVTCAQKAHHRSTHQLTSTPKPFSWTRLTCGAVNQVDEVEIIRHGRELAADSVRGKKESTVEHEYENAIKAPGNYNDFSASGCNPLKPVSQPRGSLQPFPLSR